MESFYMITNNCMPNEFSVHSNKTSPIRACTQNNIHTCIYIHKLKYMYKLTHLSDKCRFVEAKRRRSCVSVSVCASDRTGFCVSNTFEYIRIHRRSHVIKMGSSNPAKPHHFVVRQHKRHEAFEHVFSRKNAPTHAHTDMYKLTYAA